MREFSLKNSFDIGRRTSLRCAHYKVSKFIGQREIGLICNNQHVCDLSSHDCFGYAVAALQPDEPRRDGPQASAGMQLVGLGFPQNGIHIEQIVSQ